MTSRPVGQEGHCFLVLARHPDHVTDFKNANQPNILE